MTLNFQQALTLLTSFKLQAHQRLFEEMDDKLYFGQHPDIEQSIIERMLLERYLIRMLAQDAVAAGYQLRVDYGGDEGFGCKRTDSIAVVMEAIMACDDEMIYLYCPTLNPDSKTGWARFGTVCLIYGNEGWDVMSDNSVGPKIDAVMEGCNAAASALGDALCL